MEKDDKKATDQTHSRPLQLENCLFSHYACLKGSYTLPSPLSPLCTLACIYKHVWSTHITQHICCLYTGSAYWCILLPSYPRLTFFDIHVYSAALLFNGLSPFIENTGDQHTPSPTPFFLRDPENNLNMYPPYTCMTQAPAIEKGCSKRTSVAVTKQSRTHDRPTPRPARPPNIECNAPPVFRLVQFGGP